MGGAWRVFWGHLGRVLGRQFCRCGWGLGLVLACVLGEYGRGQKFAQHLVMIV